MNIVNVYDFQGPSGYFFNGIDSNLLDEFGKHNFLFNKTTSDLLKNKVGDIPNAYYNIISNKTILISDIKNEIDDIYLYNLNTNGNFKLFLGMSKDSKKIKKSCFSFISEKAKSYTRNNKNFYITIYSGLENEIDKYDILELYKECLIHNIPRNKVILLSNIIRPEKLVSKFKNKFKIHSDCDFLFLNFNEQLLFKGDELLDDSKSKFFIQKNELNNTKKYKYLFLNRRLRPHRLLILSLLSNDSLLDNNLVSFDFDYDNVDYFESYIKDNHYIKVDEYFNIKNFNKKLLNNNLVNNILIGFQKLKQINKKSLDVGDLNSIEGRHFEVDSKSLYSDSYFSIVGETEFFDNWKDYTTEKILKPIQQLHPFVVIGRPNCLKDLHEYGFKTFSEVWDESYDMEEDDNVRIDKIYKLIYSLSNKSISEWNDMYIRLQPILIHNQNLLKQFSGSIKKIEIEYKLINLLSNEPIQNYQKLL